MDGAVSKRRRPEGSGHDVSDRRDSSLIAGTKKTSANNDVFFYLPQHNVALYPQLSSGRKLLHDLR